MYKPNTKRLFIPRSAWREPRRGVCIGK